MWAFNGVANLDDEPFFRAKRGETMVIETVNNTAWPHAMHTHGHHFRVVGADGMLGPWRDTFIIDREETIRIAFVADNPGKWLYHCPHAGTCRCRHDNLVRCELTPAERIRAPACQSESHGLPQATQVFRLLGAWCCERMRGSGLTASRHKEPIAA
jgi:hypothetical protein